jgi:hypothetical protein
MLYRLKHGSLTFYIGEYNVMYSYSTDSESFDIGLRNTHYLHELQASYTISLIYFLIKYKLLI